jgi:hypothetical protein
MRRNLDSWTGSEQVLAVLTARLGRHAAREALQTALATGRRDGRPMTTTLVDAGLLTAEVATALGPDPGACVAMTDAIVARLRAARERER